MDLTDREKEVLSLLVQGLNNSEIADKLMVSIHTVKAHICSIFSKLHTTGRVQAAVKAVKEGLIK